MLTLHYHPSNASITPHILLEEMGVPFAVKLVDRSQGAHKSVEYLKLNPNGLIPVLIDDENTPPLVLYETAAICLYLVDKFPEKGFAPTVGTVERAHFYKWLVWLTNTLQPTIISYFYPDRYVNAGDSPDAKSAAAQVKTSAQARVGAMLKQLDDQLAASALHGGEWMLGKQFSVVDIYAFMLGRWTRVFEGAPPATQKASNAEAWKHLGPFMHRMLARDAVQRVVTKEALKTPFI
jgi:glutathione S-transferase